jgi:transcriptional regulator with XRE-family HTH domain
MWTLLSSCVQSQEGFIHRGWTQTELARRSGVRLKTIGRIESGKHIPRRETPLKLDRALSGK